MHHRQLFLRHVAQTSGAPLAIEITQAAGNWLWDADGKKYLDLISGIAVSNIGHGHSAVKSAINDQVDKYMHVMVYGEIVQSPQVQYATWLTNHLPSTLNSVYFVNSGSEAVEGAIKLAKRVTGKTEIISFRNSYHGSTMGALSVGNTEERKNAFRPLIPDNTVLTYNDPAAIQAISSRTAAVIIEPIQAEAGVITPNSEFLQQLREACSTHDAMFILDECQTGFGRTGTLFAFEQMNLVPDMLVLGKAVGGGMPLGCFIADIASMQAFTHDPVLGHITTFGGHPVCCAAGLAAAQVLEDEKLMEHIPNLLQVFTSKLQHPKIKSFRHAGLLMAVEFYSVEDNFSIIKKLIDKGLFVDWFLFATDCMRLAPPLTLTRHEAEHACEIILAVLNE